MPLFTHKNKLHLGKILIFIGVFLLIIALLSGIYLVKYNNSSTPLPADITKNASFGVYSLPEPIRGYEINKDETSYTNNKLVFTYQSPNNKLIFTEQAKPNNFDIKDFKEGQGLQEVREMNIPAAQALAGKVLGKEVFIVAKPETLITVVSTNSTDTALIEEALKSLAL